MPHTVPLIMLQKSQRLIYTSQQLSGQHEAATNSDEPISISCLGPYPIVTMTTLAKEIKKFLFVTWPTKKKRHNSLIMFLYFKYNGTEIRKWCVRVTAKATIESTISVKTSGSLINEAIELSLQLWLGRFHSFVVWESLADRMTTPNLLYTSTLKHKR